MEPDASYPVENPVTISGTENFNAVGIPIYSYTCLRRGVVRSHRLEDTNDRRERLPQYWLSGPARG